MSEWGRGCAESVRRRDVNTGTALRKKRVMYFNATSNYIEKWSNPISCLKIYRYTVKVGISPSPTLEFRISYFSTCGLCG